MKRRMNYGKPQEARKSQEANQKTPCFQGVSLKAQGKSQKGGCVMSVYTIIYNSGFSDKGLGKQASVTARTPAEAIFAIMETEPVTCVISISKEDCKNEI